MQIGAKMMHGQVMGNYETYIHMAHHGQRLQRT
jgi:hypothetical protein